jgi:general secretion pathway protein E
MRLVDMGIEPYLLASCLRGVLGQRLVRTLCPHCRRPIDWETAAKASDADPGWRARLAGGTLWQAVGCGRCLEGYGGRKGLFELMVCDEAVRAAIRSGRLDASELRRTAVAAGMHPLVDDALAKLRSGLTDLREVAGALSA